MAKIGCNVKHTIKNIVFCQFGLIKNSIKFLKLVQIYCTQKVKIIRRARVDDFFSAVLIRKTNFAKMLSDLHVEYTRKTRVDML